MARNRDISFDTFENDQTLNSPNGKTYFLGIGIDEYEDFVPLQNAVKDVVDFVEIVTTYYQFDQNTEIITLYNHEATYDNIDEYLRSFIDKVTPEDSVIIYFSGHGTYEQQLEVGYWIPVDGIKGKKRTFISNGEVKTYLEKINSRHTLLIIDSCFSGSLFSTTQRTAFTERMDALPSRWAITSGMTEPVSDGTGNSPFAQSILEYLRVNQNQSFGINRLIDHVQEVVVANENQTPTGNVLSIKGHKGGQFVFHPKQKDNFQHRKKEKALDKYKILFHTLYQDHHISAIERDLLKNTQHELRLTQDEVDTIENNYKDEVQIIPPDNISKNQNPSTEVVPESLTAKLSPTFTKASPIKNIIHSAITPNEGAELVEKAIRKVVNKNDPDDTVILHFGSYYIQFSEKNDYSGLYCEAVGNTYLQGDLLLQPEEIEKMVELGWESSEKTPSGNFELDVIISTDEEIKQLTEIFLFSIKEIYQHEKPILAKHIESFAS